MAKEEVTLYLPLPMFPLDKLRRPTDHLSSPLEVPARPSARAAWSAEDKSTFPHQPRGFSVFLCVFCSKKAKPISCPTVHSYSKYSFNTHFPQVLLRARLSERGGRSGVGPSPDIENFGSS